MGQELKLQFPEKIGDSLFVIVRERRARNNIMTEKGKFLEKLNWYIGSLKARVSSPKLRMKEVKNGSKRW